MTDLAVVGAGAAGLATAIFAARKNPDLSIELIDGAHKPGAKILISGGGRCNVTNVKASENDLVSASPPVVRRMLRSFTERQAAQFFDEIGVKLHEEQWGKLFPDSNDAHTVLDGLMNEAARLKVKFRFGARVESITPGFELGTTAGPIAARRVVIATGGLSIPKTGSDGGGYRLVESLGHTIVPTTPALVPFILEGTFHVDLSGIALDVELIVRAEGSKPVRVPGAMLWTHFGISGPAVLDASRYYLRAKLEKRPVTLTVNLLPGKSLETLLLEAPPKQSMRTVLGGLLTARVADAILKEAAVEPDVKIAHLPKETRRAVTKAIVERPLPVKEDRGYNYAEVTAGGVPLSEVDPATLESRTCPGLHLAGEILDVDGRIGGFNFQWAWSTGFVAGNAAASVGGAE